MTAKEKILKTNPDVSNDVLVGRYCPSDFGEKEHCAYVNRNSDCEACWNQEISAEPQEQPCTISAGEPPKCTDAPTQPQILDSGNRREFETGAVRDMQEGKGRCDLLPLDVIAIWLNDDYVIASLAEFCKTGLAEHLFDTLMVFISVNYPDQPTAILELAKHFEAGAKKYGEGNWKRGIPVHCYVDSAVRHYLKSLRGDTDEPHDRAFVWNIVCAIWTCEHKPELNEYAREEQTDD